MDTALIRLLTRATREGVELELTDNGLAVRHAQAVTLDELRQRRDDVITLLTGQCAACGRPPWIREADTLVPWCRACANLRGTQLLRHERPDLLEA